MSPERIAEFQRTTRWPTLIRLARKHADLLHDFDPGLFEAIYGRPRWAVMQHLDDLDAEAARNRAWLQTYLHDGDEAGEGLQ